MKIRKITKFEILIYLSGILPLAWLIWAYFTNNLSINPIQEATLRTGKFALIFLVLALAATPVNIIFGFKQAIKARKLLGLFSFFYASLHFLIFIGLDYGFNIEYLIEAIFEKRYAIVGFVAGLILLALAFTSTRGWKKRLGKNWKRLHKLVYIAGILVVIHYIWLVKSDIRIPMLYGLTVVILLILRLPLVRKSFRNFRIRMRNKLSLINGNRTRSERLFRRSDNISDQMSEL